MSEKASVKKADVFSFLTLDYKPSKSVRRFIHIKRGLVPHGSISHNFNHPLIDYTMKTNENPDDDYQKRIEDYGPEAEKEIEEGVKQNSMPTTKPSSHE